MGVYLTDRAHSGTLRPCYGRASSGIIAARHAQIAAGSGGTSVAPERSSRRLTRTLSPSTSE